MGFLAQAIATKASDPLAVWAEMLRAGVTSKAGATVNLDTAIKVATLFACLRILSQGVAQVPFKLYLETEVDGLTRITQAREHGLYDLLAMQPNGWSTSYEFRETLTIHAALGNAYVFVNRFGAKTKELYLLNPGRVTVEQQEPWNPPVYKVVGASGDAIRIPQEAIWHIKGPSWTGFAGMDMLKVAREALGLSIATEETHATLHAKGVRPSGLYSVDKSLNPSQYEQLKKWIDKELAGADNAGGALLLDNGAKYVSTAMSGLDSQHLETRKHQIEEVCRFMGVMPIMVGYSDKATTYASSEQMFIAHVVHTLSPWYSRIEQSAGVHLLTKKERDQGYYFKFNAAGLLRGAMKDQGEFFARMLGAGGTRQILTQDECRKLLEFDPMGGDAGMLHAPQSATPEPKGTQ